MATGNLRLDTSPLGAATRSLGGQTRGQGGGLAQKKRRKSGLEDLPTILSLLRFKEQQAASERAQQDREKKEAKETHEELVTIPKQQRVKEEKERQQNIKFNQNQIDRQRRCKSNPNLAGKAKDKARKHQFD